MAKHKNFWVLSVVLVVAAAAVIDGAVPTAISYQGRLTDEAGSPVTDGTYQIKFKIYGSPTGSDSVWSSGFQPVTVTDGLFNYRLGESVPIPPNLFVTTTRYLGITVGVGQEGVPRIQFVAVPYASHSQNADYAGLADDAQALAGEEPSFYLNWGDMINVPACFADGIDDIGSGDITEVVATGGLIGGGPSGAVTLEVAPNGITSDKIAALTITNSDINPSANISISKISGTAVNLDSTQTITADKTFAGEVLFSDSTMRVSANGIRIGDSFSPPDSDLVHIERDFPAGDDEYGLNLSLGRSGSGYGYLYGVNSRVVDQNYSSVCALRGFAMTSGLYRYGLWCKAEGYDHAATGPYSYGVYSEARDGHWAMGVYAYAHYAEENYGIWAACATSNGNYGGYFYGNVECTGGYTKSGGGFKIDHPDDPENMYLFHSDVSSPDMMNIYNGNITTDGNGEAVVELPGYFESLNSDFRYQLTVIGTFAQAIVSEKINSNHFSIKTDKPFVEVSWQVTGIRKDAFATNMRGSAEEYKPVDERGLYRNPELFGFGLEKSIDKDHFQDQQDRETRIED